MERVRRADVRLLTLTGPGGTGKTRLALQAAAELVDEYPDGVWFVGLAALADPTLVVTTIAQALGVRGSGEAPEEALLAEHLRRRRALLVLDNLEHLLPDAAPVVAELASAAADVDFITSSREPLRLSGEHEYPVPPLTLDEAIALFVDRVRAFRPGFAIHGSRPAVEEICARLDHLPLAIELAAARVRVLTPEKLVERLGQRLPLLTGGTRDAPARQRTLQAAIAWSYDLLAPDEQRLFAWSGVFAGGWTVEAAESVCGADLDTLESQVDKSLVYVAPDEGGDTRYGMLETIREFALDRLAESSEGDDVRRRHAEHYLALAEGAERELRGPVQTEWIRRLELELDNLRAAISWSLATGGDPALGARMATALTPFWETQGYWQEASGWLEQLIRTPGSPDSSVRARVLLAAGRLAGFRGDVETASSFLEESVEAARSAEDRRTLALALASFTWTRSMHGLDAEASIAFGEEAVRVARDLGDPWVVAETLNDLAGALTEASYSEWAIPLFEESLDLRRQLGDVRGIADSLNNLGWNTLLQGDYRRSARFLEDSLALARQAGAKPHILLAEDNLALVHLLLDEPREAEPLFLNGIRTCRELGDLRIGEEALLGLAGVAAVKEEWERSAWLAGAAAGVAASTGATSNAAYDEICDRFVARARREMGDDAFHRAYEKGRRASFDEAVDRALDTASARGDP
jgi:predicted ATPase